MIENSTKNFDWKSLWLLPIMIAIVLFLVLPGAASARTSTKSFDAAADVTIEARFSSSNYGYWSTCYAGGLYGRERSTLMEWNISSLPKYSRVKKATIQLRVDDPSNGIFEVYGLKKDWIESEATWLRASDRLLWTNKGASSTSSRLGDRDWLSAGTLRARQAGTAKIELDAGLVQDWLDGTRRNYGVIIAAGSSGAADDIAFFCSETAQRTQRPQLVIEFEY